MLVVVKSSDHRGVQRLLPHDGAGRAAERHQGGFFVYALLHRACLGSVHRIGVSILSWSSKIDFILCGSSQLRVLRDADLLSGHHHRRSRLVLAAQCSYCFIAQCMHACIIFISALFHLLTFC